MNTIFTALTALWMGGMVIAFVWLLTGLFRGGAVGKPLLVMMIFLALMGSVTAFVEYTDPVDLQTLSAAPSRSVPETVAETAPEPEPTPEPTTDWSSWFETTPEPETVAVPEGSYEDPVDADQAAETYVEPVAEWTPEPTPVPTPTPAPTPAPTPQPTPEKQVCITKDARGPDGYRNSEGKWVYHFSTGCRTLDGTDMSTLTWMSESDAIAEGGGRCKVCNWR